MYYYAQLNASGVCIGVSALSGPVEAAHMIPLTEAQYAEGDCLGRKFESGQWGTKITSGGEDK
jgi:hypothetical protein